MKRKVQQTIYLDPDQMERMKLLSDRTHVPMAVYIRKGIDFVLEHLESQESNNEKEEMKVR